MAAEQPGPHRQHEASAMPLSGGLFAVEFAAVTDQPQNDMRTAMSPDDVFINPEQSLLQFL